MKLTEKRRRELTFILFGCIPWGVIEKQLTPEEWKEFCEFMEGQTSCEYGVYVDDLRRFIEGLPVID
jgi:hypothetical protein